MTPQCEKIMEKLGRRYADLGFPDHLVRSQSRRELYSLVLRSWEAGAPFRVIGERLGISRQRANQIKNRAAKWRSMLSPLEGALAESGKIPRTTVNVPMFRVGEVSPEFSIKFRGRRAREFMTVPGGSEPIRAALRTRGLDPDDYWTSPFFIEETTIANGWFERTPT